MAGDGTFRYMTNARTDRQLDNKQHNDKQHKRALTTLLEKGVASIGLGAACLVAPSLLEPSPTANSIAAGLRMGGWIALAVGIVLLCVRFSIQSKARKLSSLPRRDNSKFEPGQESGQDHQARQAYPAFSEDNVGATSSFAMGPTQVPVPEAITGSLKDARARP